MTRRQVLRRAGPVVVVVSAVAGCGSSDADYEPGVAAVNSRSLPEAIAAAGALSGLLTAPNLVESCGLRPGGEAECWGSRVSRPGPEGVFVSVSSGQGYRCGLRLSGEVDCWGNDVLNFYGQMDAPAAVFTAVDAARHRTCGLRPGGAVECWGGVWELLEGVAAPAPDVAFPGGADAGTCTRGESTTRCG